MKRLWYTGSFGRDSVPLSSVRYLEGSGNYTYIWLENGKSLLVALTMKSLLADLDESFIRIHKTYAVNSNFIKSMNEMVVELDNGDRLRISRRMATKFLRPKDNAFNHTQEPMKKTKKKELVFFAPPVPEKPKPTQIDYIKGLFYYFGYEPTTPEVAGYLGFEHKVFPGNRVIYAKHNGCICKITFCEPGTGSFVMGGQSAMPKTWTGLFTAVRNHTRRLIAMRDAQYKQKAA